MMSKAAYFLFVFHIIRRLTGFSTLMHSVK
jgi:hypothetical protein